MKHIHELNDWREAINEVVCGDSLELMKMIPDKSIDLVLTDPPYGINEKFIGGKTGKMNFNVIFEKGWDKIPTEEYFLELFRVSKNQVIWGANHFNLPTYRGVIVWDKRIPEDFSLSMCEIAFSSYNKRGMIFRQHNSVEGKKQHPTQKPLELFRWILQNYAQKGDLIFDGFAGSFTTARACKDMGFNWICCEKELDYCRIGESRLSQQVMDFS